MNKFNEVAQTVLKEEIDSKIGSHYRQITDILAKNGIEAFEQHKILEVVQKAIKLAFNEGYKAAEKNPFK
jgi:hypothetical protein